MKSTITLKGGADGYILKIEDSLGFKDDIAMTLQEVSQLYKIMSRRQKEFEVDEDVKLKAVFKDKFKARRVIKADTNNYKKANKK